MRKEMYCHFCGRNFEPAEGFQEVNRHIRRLIRCEYCREEGREEEYDWRQEKSRWAGRGSRRRFV